MSLDQLVSMLPVLAVAYALVMAGAALSACWQWYRQPRARRGSRSTPTAVTGRGDTAGGAQ